MSPVEADVFAAIALWADESAGVRRVWLLGSCAAAADEGLGLAIELEPVGDSEETLARWMACADRWKSELHRRVLTPVDLDWFDPDGSTPTIAARLREPNVLVYERP